MLSSPIGSSLLTHPRRRVCVHRPRIKNWGAGGAGAGVGEPVRSAPYGPSPTLRQKSRAEGKTEFVCWGRG